VGVITPTLALSAVDLKHLFDSRRKCRTHAIGLYRIFVRSNAHLIEQGYDRTVIRVRVAGEDAGDERDAGGRDALRGGRDVMRAAET